MEVRLQQDVMLTVELTTQGVGSTDRSHQANVQDFIDYTNEISGVKLASGLSEPSAGTKGGWEQIVLEVASPGAVVALFRLYLHRDRRRSVRVTIKSGHQPDVEIEATGEAISLDALKTAVEAAFRSTGKQRR
jgi:hypothetical protein